jgi:hypothetical protein
VTLAIIVDVWVREQGHGGVDILQPYLRRSDPHVSGPQPIALTATQTGLLAWVAETGKSIWLDDIQVGATSGVNRLGGDNIEGRYFNLYHESRAFAAVPINYRGHFAILTAEVAVPTYLKNYHIDLMKSLSEPTGILIWKAGVSQAIRNHTTEAIQEFRDASGGFAPTFNPYRTGFIARPFDPRFDFVGRTIESVFRRKRVRAVTYRPAGGSSLVVSDMLTQINTAHFGIADITALNLNVLFETGAMIAADKPRIILRDRTDNTPVPFDLAGYDIYRYSVEQDSIMISDATQGVPLEEFVSDYTSRLLETDRNFASAKEFIW